MSYTVYKDTTDQPWHGLSFITISGGPSDVTAQAARREVRAQAAKRSADKRRATIVKRYGSNSNARHRIILPGESLLIRRRRPAKTRLEQARRNDAMSVGDRSFAPGLQSTSFTVCGGSPDEDIGPCPQGRPCDMPVLRDIDINWPHSQAPQFRLSSAQVWGANESTEQFAASTEGLRHLDSSQPLQWTRASETAQPRMLPFAPDSLACHCFAHLVPDIQQCDILPVLPDVALGINTPLSIENHNQMSISAPLDSHSTRPAHFPTWSKTWQGIRSPMPIGFAFLHRQHLLPHDLLSSVVKVINIDLSGPNVVSRIMSAGIDLFSAPSYSPVSTTDDGALSAHVGTYLRLAGGLILTTLHELVTDEDELFPGPIQDGIMEEWRKYLTIESCTLVGTLYDDILLWSVSMIYVTTGQLNGTHWHFMRELADRVLISSFATFKGIIQRFGCPEILEWMLANLWEGMTKPVD